MSDRYFEQMKLPKRGSSKQYNGNGFTLDNGKLKNMNSEEDFFLSTGSIDPNQQRQYYDPQHALPDDFSNGSGLYDNIVLDKGAYISEYTDTQELADINFKNYRDRFKILDNLKEE